MTKGECSMKSGWFYTYEDRYGWRVAAKTHAPKCESWAAYHCPEVFGRRGDAEGYIKALCEEGAQWGPGGKQ
jgi:hypothetical protein